MTSGKNSDHFKYLDSMRGIAAIMVMVYHYANKNYVGLIYAKMIPFIFNGRDAVSFFFVLSGFVLSYKYIVLKQPLDIRKFYVQRIFRLWPPFFVCMVLIALSWMSGKWDMKNIVYVFVLNKTHFWDEASLLKVHLQYFRAGWTLAVELAISFLIPFLILIANKNIKLLFWLVIAFLLVQGIMGYWYLFHFHFTLGILISGYFGYIHSDEFKASRIYRSRHIILVFAVFFFSLRHIDGILHFNEKYHLLTLFDKIDFFHYSGAASFLFLVLIICSPKTQKVLNNRILVFLGKISYGIYLMHWLLRLIIIKFVPDIDQHIHNLKASYMISFIVYIASTVVLAILLHYIVELPFIRLGKKIAARLKPSVVIS